MNAALGLCRSALACLVAGALCVGALAGESDALARAAAVAGVPADGWIVDLRPYTPVPPDALQPPVLLRSLQAQPLRAHELARGLRAGFGRDARRPAALLARAAELYGPAQDGVAPPASPVPPDDGGDPLAVALQRLRHMAGVTGTGDLAQPAGTPAERRLRAAVAGVLHAVVDAEVARRRALAAVPPALTAALLVAHLADPAPGDTGREAMVRRAVAALDRAALAHGLLRLAAATEQLARALPALAMDARVDWHWSTPWGEVVVDTTGRDQTRRLHDPLLVVDVGGNDRYVFASRSPRNRIALLLDVGGDEHYEAAEPGADVASGILGYGVLWDTGGDDVHAGGWLAQAAAAFGGVLLVDEGGDDRYQATALSQGFAFGGLAVLADLAGDDQYVAATHAQGSAGPGGVALLLDAAGDDRYQLEAAPLVMPSSQLPDRNSSMGQGAGRGLRETAHAPAMAGGLGMLFDLAGDDRYSAQVFAQGAGYHFGVGLLVDGGGADRFDAAWYAMGAAAHAAAGVLLAEGVDDDHYRASHATSLGAAHDGSVASFRDEGGGDRYALGNLGFGAAQDASVAVFIDVAGDDHYDSGGPPCHAFGIARHSPELPVAPPGVGLGLFLDLHGRDAYPSQCPVARDDAAWSSEDGQTVVDRRARPASAGVAAGVDTRAGDAP